MLVDDVLNLFGKRVIKQSRANLTRTKKNASKKLYDSLKYKIEKKSI